MQLKIILETKRLNGSVDLRRVDFEQRQVLVGRDAAADLRLESRYVSLKHCRLYEQEGSLVVEDLGSTRPILVNGKIASRASLLEGDQILIGDLVLRVERATTPFGLRLVQQEEEIKDRKMAVASQIERFSFSHLPFIVGGLSLVVILGLGLSVAIVPAVGSSKNFWSPGPLSSAHRPLEAQCDACHDSDFGTVKDAKCLSCHSLSIHSDMAEFQSSSHRCIDCHLEHQNGKDLIVANSAACLDCHSKFAASFEEHPDFILEPRPKTDSLGAYFPHDKHLKVKMRTDQGLRWLHCLDCHTATAQRLEFGAPTFETSCRSCHPLSVPHASPNAVFQFLLKNSLSDEEEARVNRRRPGEISSAQSVMDPRQIEKLLFEVTSCRICHQIERKDSFGARESAYILKALSSKPSLMKSFKDLHRSHQAFDCLTCHARALTGEFAIASIENCQSCHSDEDETAKVKSDCGFCHSYHQTVTFDQNREPFEMIERKE